MNFTIEEEHGYLVLRFTGEVDINCHPHARDVILDCLKQGNNTAIDLSAVTYIDSSGIASLVESFQLAKENDLKFGLVDISDKVLSVLQLAHLDKAFPTYGSIAELP